MKKVFFTAIALVAFSAVSMANNIAEEREIETKEQELVVVSEYPCTDDWSADMYIYQKWGYSFEESLAFADEAWDICMEETYGN